MTEIKPVAWAYEFHEFGNVWARHVIFNRSDGGANPPTKHYGSEVRNVLPLYGPEAMAEIERLRTELKWACRFPVDETAYRRWKRGEKIEALASEHRITRERMRHKLERLDQTVPLIDRLEEADKLVARLRAEIDRKSSMPADHRYWEGRYRDEAAENERLRKALEPFALISAEGVIGHDRVFVRVTTCAEYYHAAAEALKEKTP